MPTSPRKRPDSQTMTLVDRLLDSYTSSSGAMQHVNSYELPSMEAVATILEQCRTLIFPGFVGPSLIRSTLTELREMVHERVSSLRVSLRRQIYRGLHHKVQLEKGTRELDCPHCAAKAEDITESFLEDLINIREIIADDVQAHYEGDPAASGTDEIIFCYPGLYATTVHRIAHALLKGGAKLIPRMMSELAHKEVGIDIHPAAQIGKSFFIDHGTGVVIGETTVIGQNVRIYQGVTLGALSVTDRDVCARKRHPTLEDGVIIYAGATILGGETVIGKGAVIGGNCWVTSSVAPGSVVTLNGSRGKGA
jgi:serine O-acetyltransferase